MRPSDPGQQYGQAVRASLLGASAEGGFFMGDLIPFSRVALRRQVKDLRIYATRGQCRSEFLFRSFEAMEAALDGIEGARDEFLETLSPPEMSNPEFLALGFVLYRLSRTGIDTMAILESVATQLERFHSPLADDAFNQIITANNHAALNTLPKRRTIAQIMDPGASGEDEVIGNRASWLKRWRERLGITQVEAARILGYKDRRQIGKIEAGYARPSWEKIFLAIAAEEARS
jgi:DNA-binding XRE family transcriptional regulator